MLLIIYVMMTLAWSTLSIGLALEVALIISTYLPAATWVRLKYILPYFTSKRYILFIVFLLLLVLPCMADDISMSWIFDTRDLSLMNSTGFEIGMNIWSCNFVFGVTGLIYSQGKSMVQALENQMSLKNEKLVTELNFLKAQINPHFLFNTLNKIYFYA